MSHHHQRLLLYEELTCFIFACACVCSFVCVCSFACVGSISLRKPGNVMTINYEEKKKKPPPPPPSSSNSSPPPPSSREQFVVVTVPPGEGPGSKLKATFHGNTFVITVPDGVSPGQKIKVKVPFKVSSGSLLSVLSLLIFFSH